MAQIPTARPRCYHRLMLTQIHSPIGGLGPIFDIAHDGAHVVAVGGQGRDLFLSSTDAGQTFVQRASLGSGLRAAMVEGDEVWVCGEWGYLAHSPDRGRTWNRRSSGAQRCLFGIARAADGTLWLTGDQGYVARSSDGWRFESLDPVTSFACRLGRTPNDLFVLTHRPGRIFRIHDDWLEALNLQVDLPLTDACVTASGALLVVGDGGLFFRSSDAGRTFVRVDAGFDVDLEGVAALDDGRVVVVGHNGRCWRSHDDGQTFVLHDASLLPDTLWCATTTGDVVLIGGHDGNIVRFGKRRQTPRKLAPQDPDAPPAERPHWQARPHPHETQEWEPDPGIG